MVIPGEPPYITVSTACLTAQNCHFCIVFQGDMIVKQTIDSKPVAGKPFFCSKEGSKNVYIQQSGTNFACINLNSRPAPLTFGPRVQHTGDLTRAPQDSNFNTYGRHTACG